MKSDRRRVNEIMKKRTRTIGILLILGFSVNLGLFPSYGAGDGLRSGDAHGCVSGTCIKHKPVLHIQRIV